MAAPPPALAGCCRTISWPRTGSSSARAARLVAHAGRNRRVGTGVRVSRRPARSPSPLRRDVPAPAPPSAAPASSEESGSESGSGTASAAAVAATTPELSPPAPSNKRGASAGDRHAGGRSGDGAGLPRPPGGRLARPDKAELFLYRTDGLSCSRELVKPGGTLTLAHPSTQQQLLVWGTRPKAVMVLKKLGPDTEAAFTDVVAYLAAEEGLLVLVEPHELEKLLARRPDLAPSVDTYTAQEATSLADAVDFVVCLGGDGLVLHASSLFPRATPPVIAFNLGSLGFLTNHLITDFRADLAAVIASSSSFSSSSSAASSSASSADGGDGVPITLRMRLECAVVRAGQAGAATYEVLNEVVVDRGSSPYLTKLECWDRGRLVTKVQADGVMLATPTGSTAYSVAAGGSMVHPNVPAILFTPICPHSLSFRPVVLPDYAELELRVAGDMRSTAFVSFDGKGRQELGQGDVVRVRMSTHPVPTISKAGSTNDWFDTLNRCFGWNERLEQKAR